MRIVLAFAALLALVQPVSRGYPIRAVPLGDVRVQDGFWGARLETNRRVTIPHIFRQNEQTGRVANFAKAAKRLAGAYEGRRFNDTDVYKAIEAASYSLVHRRDAALEQQLDDLIALVAAAQEPDGYLYPARTVDPANPAPGAGPARWTHLNGSHELYNAGHLYEAAVAHHAATGKRSLLDVAVRNANLMASVFGPKGRKAVPGHQEIELALVRLAAATGNAQYVELARFFLEERGQPHETEPYPDGPFAMYNDREYRQDHAPVRLQTRAVGHAVRATYMYAGMTDIAALLDPPDYRVALTRLWNDVVSKRMYVTGGIGARGGTESFGDDYELPNLRAYTETCAAVGVEQWSHRMFRLTGEARYLDLAELVLYNGALSGVSLSGDRFFYQNPLASDGRAERVPYFDVACCPANLARTVAQLPGLAYAASDDTLYVGLFVASEAAITVGGTTVRLRQRTPYPWSGDAELRVEPGRAAEFTMAVRIPGWALGQPVDSDLYRFHDREVSSPTLTVNGDAVRVVLDRGFARIRRRWSSGDVVHLYLPMPVQRVHAHPSVVETRGRTAIQRGPLVYAIEAADHDGSIDGLRLPLDAELTHTFRGDLLGGVAAITGQAIGRDGEKEVPQSLVAIPYFAWANRGKGAMTVWIPY